MVTSWADSSRIKQSFWCLVVHQGAEAWNIPIRLPFGWIVPLTNGVRGINIPLLPYKKLDHYVALCKRYQPVVGAKDLQGKSKAQVRRLLNIEIEPIRAEMNLMTDELKVRMRQARTVRKLAEQLTPVRWFGGIARSPAFGH